MYQSYEKQSYSLNSEPPLKRHLYSIENYIKLFYVVLVSFQFNGCYIGIISSVLGLIRRKSMHTDFTMNILYLMNISLFKCTNNFMYHLPIVIHYVVGITEYINLRGGFMYDVCRNFVFTIQFTKEFFFDFRCKYELLLVPLSVVMVIVSDSSWWLVILHSFYVVTKTVANKEMLDVCMYYKKKLRLILLI
ncbi:unnamed protein product [Paramecium octaurelia]|uniref:Uncharacterized protein n=1 Tax=Paramecium octaurelia TaxID=43137 RepID=A0A8S1S5D7_PAROT|nr:unnamed protein product [Paramecium octaurelia]